MADQQPFKKGPTIQSKRLVKLKSPAPNNETKIKAEIEHALSQLKETYLNKNFDTVNEIVEILIGSNHNKEADKLSAILLQLNQILESLCENRDQDFNNILFSVRPLEHKLGELVANMDGLQKSVKVIKEDMTNKTNLQNLRQLQLKSLYYQEMVEGLQIFEKIERSFEELDFLSNQNNLLSASQMFANLKKTVLEDSKTKQIMTEFGTQELTKKRLLEKQRILLDRITTDINAILFVKSNEACMTRVSTLTQFLKQYTETNEGQDLMHIITNETGEVIRMHEQLQRAHRKDLESAMKVNELLINQEQNPQESVATGLMCLQKEQEQAIGTLNIAYLVLLLMAFKRTSTEYTLQEFLRNKMDFEMQGLFTRTLKIMIKNHRRKTSKPSTALDNKALVELLQLNTGEINKIMNSLQVLFFQFQSNLSYFIVIDKIYAQESDGISLDYVNGFLYYFKMIIQVLFDHDRRLKEFNDKNSISEETVPSIARKIPIEKNMRFSFRNKEEQGENFLTDNVRLKLDFITQLEELMVPKLMSKNITLVMTSGQKLLSMIEAFVEMADKNLFNQKDHENKQYLVAYVGWMNRFIVTNYEIYLDHFKQHSDLITQKYFVRQLVTDQTQSLMKSNSQDENLIVDSELQAKKLLDKDIFDCIDAFSQVARLAIERIPLQDKNKSDQGQFRQEVLEALNKVMKKTFDKVNELAQYCFSDSHYEQLFPYQLYLSEKETHVFLGIVMCTDSQSEHITNGVEDVDFLYRPKLAMKNELLSNSITTMTLLFQLFYKLKTKALKEFYYCSHTVTNNGQWENYIEEKVRQEYYDQYFKIQQLLYDILIFFKCELISRTFSHLREMTRIDFSGSSGVNRVEGFVLSLVRDVKILFNFMDQVLDENEMFFLFAHLQKLAFKLYGHNLRYLKRQQMDEGGYQRLKGSLFHMRVEMDLLVPKLFQFENQQSTSLQKMVAKIRNQIAREYEKTIYILELMDSEESEIPLKIKENDYGLNFSDFEALLSIETHKHKGFNEIKRETLRKMFGAS